MFSSSQQDNTDHTELLQAKIQIGNVDILLGFMFFHLRKLEREKCFFKFCGIRSTGGPRLVRFQLVRSPV